MNGLALCAGVGGLELGLRLAIGDTYRTVCYVERDTAAAKVLHSRMDILGRGPVIEELSSFDGLGWQVDIISAGWPCQGFSTATRGRPRQTDLWPHVRRIIEEVQPRCCVFLENIPRAPWSVVEKDLRLRGWRTAHEVYCPSDMGAPHRRPRGFLLAYPDSQSQSRGTKYEEVARVPLVSGRDRKARTRGLGVDDGTPRRMDRLRCLGNGVVPAVAARAFCELATRLATHKPHHEPHEGE